MASRWSKPSWRSCRTSCLAPHPPPEPGNIDLGLEGTRHRSTLSLVQPALADTLAQLRQAGADHFYQSSLAAQSVRYLRSHGSSLTAEDFAAFQPETVEPTSVGFGGLTVGELPAQLRQYARFTPTRRMKFAGNAMAAALESDTLFRQRIGERLRDAKLRRLPGQHCVRDARPVSRRARSGAWVQGGIG